MPSSRWHKYGARAVSIDGHRFASKREGARYKELKLLARSGEIVDLRLHPKYLLQPKFTTAGGEKVRAIYYIADFQYVDTESGKTVIEDVKGVKTAAFKLKWKLLKYRFRGDPLIAFALT